MVTEKISDKSSRSYKKISRDDRWKFDGLECFYTTFTEEQSAYLVRLCKERGLLISGGSDFHGTIKSNHDLGVGRGNLCIEESMVL